MAGLCVEAVADPLEQLLAPGPLFGRGHHHRRQLLPLLRKGLREAGDAAAGLRSGELVGLGEDDSERDAVFAQHLDEAQVDLLRFEPDVDQHEQEVQLLAAEHVVGDDLGELVAPALRRAGVAVARQVDQIPPTVDQKVVDKPRLAGRSRDFGQPGAPGKHVDQRRFAHVAAPDEGDLFEVVFGNLSDALGRTAKFGFVDLHGAKIRTFPEIGVNANIYTEILYLYTINYPKYYEKNFYCSSIIYPGRT